MEELFELKRYVEQQDYVNALTLIGEMEEMSRDDKINKTESFLEILMLHLIKQHAEQRSTRSWEISIRNAVRAIHRTNKRRKSGGYYLTEEDLKTSIDEIYPAALDSASLETFEGRYDGPELAEKVDAKQIRKEAFQLILESRTRKQGCV